MYALFVEICYGEIMKKINKMVRISLAGGIIGLIFTNPRKALDKIIEKNNEDGWNAIYYTTHSESNLIIILIQWLVLIFTLGLWTFGAGYLILFEKEKSK